MDLRINALRDRKMGYVLAFGALIWSGTYNALAKGLTPYLSPMSLLIITELLTAVFIIVTFGLVPLLKKLMKMDGASIRMAVIIGLLNSAICPILWFAGLARTSAINATMLSTADVLAVLFLGAFLLKERISKMQVIGAGVVLFGVIIINVRDLSTGINVNIGDMMILAAALISGTGSVLFKKYISHVMPELAIAIRNVAGVVAILIVSLFIQHSFVAEFQTFPVDKILLLVAFVFFSRYLNLTFYYEALDRLPVTVISLIQIAAPLSGLVFAFLLLGEQIYNYQILGGIFIILGLTMEQVSANSLRTIRAKSGIFSFKRLRSRKTILVQDSMHALPMDI